MEYTEKIELKIEAIAQDNSSGSSELSRRAAVALLDILADIGDAPETTLELLHSALHLFAQRLLQVQPKMATLFNLVNGTLLVLNGQTTFSDAKLDLEKYVYNFLSTVVGSSEQISQQVQPLIQDGSIVLNHSYSATVIKTLINAKRSGRNFQVFCTESRPIMEGRKAAQALAAEGIPVTLLVDAAAIFAIQRCSLVLLGADAVRLDGITNKIGSTMIALAARASKKPCCVLSDTTKLLPTRHRLRLEEMHPGNEVWAEVPEEIIVFNRYFEITPLELFTSVITEHGILKIPEVKMHINSLVVSNELCAEV